MKFWHLILFLGDIGMLYAALAITLWLRHREVPFEDYWAHHVLPFSLIFLLWIGVFYLYDLYNEKFAKLMGNFLSRLMQAMALNGMLAVAFFYFTGVFRITPKTNLLLFWVFFLLLFLLWRAAIGLVYLSFRQTPRVYYIGVPGKESVSSQKADLVIYGETQTEQEKRALYQYLVQGTPIVDVVSYWERNHEQIPVDLARTDWILHAFEANERRLYQITKRVFDFTLALLLSILFLPVACVVALLIRLTSPGPVLFSQTRVRKYGKHFTLYKFRSMVVDAEKTGPQWAQKNDPRVTRIGRILRHTHLDEIPQLFNVLKGDMSFVGPRPERPEIIEQLNEQIPHYALRHLVPPGITGWAQINYPYGASVEDAKQKLAYDLYYVKHRAFFYDVSILLLTGVMLFKGEGR